MKHLCILLFTIVLFCLSGLNNTAVAQGPRSASGSYSQFMDGGPAQREGGISKAPPGGGDQNSGVSPIGSGFTILIGLSFCYLSYILVTNSKKEKK